MLKWGPQESADFGGAFTALLETLLPRALEIRAFCRARAVQPTVEFVTYFRNTAPRFVLTQEDLAAIASLSAGLWYAPYPKRD